MGLLHDIFHKSTEETLEDIILKKQKKLASPKEQKKLAEETRAEQAAAAACFNVASDIAKGLAKLQAIPGSTFTCTEVQKSEEGYVIHTNIPRGAKEIDVDVIGIDGKAAAYVHVAGGKADTDAGDAVCVLNGVEEIPGEIVASIARHAVRAGMIPKIEGSHRGHAPKI